MTKIVMNYYIFEVDFEYSEMLQELYNNRYSYQKELRLKHVISLLKICIIKRSMLHM